MNQYLRRQAQLVVVTALLAFAVMGAGQVPEKKAAPPTKDRTELLAEVAQARADLERIPSGTETRLRLARLLYQAGDFEGSRSALAPFLGPVEAPAEALVLAADLDYLFGRYESAERYLLSIMARGDLDQPSRVKVQVKLLFVYYQTNDYEKGAGLFKGMEGQIKLPLLDLMRTFGQEKPYALDWPPGPGRAEVPFLVTDPLPIVSVEVQGRPIYALIDTGADMFVLDNEIATALGVRSQASTTGTFAGGRTAEVGFAKVDSLKIGGVTLRSVPVSLLPTQRFSTGFAGGKYTIGGIVSTGVLKQFLPTLDYPRGRLVLRRRDEGGLADLRRVMPAGRTVELPFVLALSHFMLAKGRLDGVEGLTFFVDSGLASEAAFTGPAETLRLAGIPIPETKFDPGSIGGGGGAGFATGLFPIKKLGLGPLLQTDKKGDFGGFPPNGRWMLGLLNDGIISHQFLRRYAWTINFSTMRMIFVE